MIKSERDISMATNDRLQIARENFKNKLTSSSELSSSADELNAANDAWNAVETIEPTLASSKSSDTIEKRCTPSPPVTPAYSGFNPSVNSTKNTSPSHLSSLHSLAHGSSSDQLSWQHVPSYQLDISGQHYRRGCSPLHSTSPTPHRVTPIIDFDEAWEYFLRQDMTHLKDLIKPNVDRRGLSGILRGVFGPRRLKQELLKERDLLFCIAQTPLSNEEPLHLQMLFTIYRRLTGATVNCPRYGPHWDNIGFQGNDPATDLRGVGLLGLLQMVYLVTGETSQLLASDVFSLSHDPHSQFPLMVLCLNVTRITVQALREGALNRECNCRGNVRHVLNEFFAAVLYHIYYIWRTERKSITDSGYLIKDAEAYCKRNVRRVLFRLQQHQKSIDEQHLV